jgi:hypothetical protein
MISSGLWGHMQTMRHSRSMRALVVGWGLVAACSSPKQAPLDGSVSDARADAQSDAESDAPADAAVPIVLPDFADLSSAPCANTLAFPQPSATVPLSGSGPVVLVDVNVDGIEDLVLQNGTRIYVALGVGDATYGPPVQKTTSKGDALALGDVNGDGRPDLVTASSLSSDPNVQLVWMSLNDGNGGFKSPSRSSIGSFRVKQIEVMDLDGDARPDIVALSTSELVVRRNTGTSFDPPVAYAAGAASQMAIADLTGDGQLDVVTTDDTAGTVSVFVNTGNGTFGNRVVYASPSPLGIALADMNEDGKRDAVLGSGTAATGAQIAVMINQGGGVLGVATSYPAGAGPAPHSVSVADVDGDGHLDVGIAGTRDYHTTPRLLRGTGSGQLGAATEFPHAARTRQILFADLNRDGRLDMMLDAGFGATPYLNDGTSNLFVTRSTSKLVETGAYATLRMTDVDRDGRLDWIATGGSEGQRATVTVRLQTSTGGFEPAMSTASSFIGFQPVVADMNNDGRLDLALQGYCADQCASAPEGIQTMLDNGDGTWTVGTPRAVEYHAGQRVAADVTGDDIRDLVIGDLGLHPDYAGAVRYYPGLGGEFGPGVLVWSGNSLHGLVAADLNNDGMRDLVVGSEPALEPRVEVLLATGAGTFAPAVTLGGFVPNERLYARDFNADGKLDLVGFRSNYLVMLPGNGDGTFGSSVISNAPHASGLYGSRKIDAFADFNGDGHLDLAIPASSAVGLSLGRGDGTFDEPRHYETGGSTGALAVGDLDGDGRLDMLVNNEGDNVSVLRALCVP